MSYAKIANGRGSWNGGPMLVEWIFEAGKLPIEGMVVRAGEERYAGPDVVLVRRFEAINGSTDTYLRFATYVPREKAERLYRELTGKGGGFKLVKRAAES